MQLDHYFSVSILNYPVLLYKAKYVLVGHFYLVFSLKIDSDHDHPTLKYTNIDISNIQLTNDGAMKYMALKPFFQIEKRVTKELVKFTTRWYKVLGDI
jgi:hypothetical protein